MENNNLIQNSKFEDYLFNWLTESELKKDNYFLYQHRGFHIHEGLDSFTAAIYAPAAKFINIKIFTANQSSHYIGYLKQIPEANNLWCFAGQFEQTFSTYVYEIQDKEGNIMQRVDPFGTSVALNDKDQLQTKIMNEKFVWKDEQYLGLRKFRNNLRSPLAIYEVFLQQWMQRETDGGQQLNFEELIQPLIKHCKEMGYTHVEFYGILDNGNIYGWGYLVHGYFAPNRRLGLENSFKLLVDALHHENIGVIVDWIPGHFSQRPQHEGIYDLDGSFMYGNNKSEWGSIFFDFEQPETRQFLLSSAVYWINEMHIDAIRVDAVSHITQLHDKDYPPGQSWLRELNQVTHQLFPDVMMICEDPNFYPQLTDPGWEGGFGFDLIWGIWPINCARNMLKTPVQERNKHGHHENHFMNFLKQAKNLPFKMILTHSHDEVANRHHSKNEKFDGNLFQISSFTEHQQKLKDSQNLLTYMMMAPNYGFLLHMGDDIGQQRDFNACFHHYHGNVNWWVEQEQYKESPLHLSHQLWISSVIQLYVSNLCFWSNGPYNFYMCCEHQSNNVIAFERSDYETGEGFIIIQNFSELHVKDYIIQMGESTRKDQLQDLKIVLNSESPEFGGQQVDLQNLQYVYINRDSKWIPTDFQINLYPLSTIILRKILN